MNNKKSRFLSTLPQVTSIVSMIFAIFAILTLIGYQKIDRKLMPKVLIQEAKFSKSQIANFTNLDEAKNVVFVRDDKEYKKTIELLRESADAISYANQIGRLDLVSILLAIIAVLFGLLGVGGFFYIKEMVSVKADTAIKEYLSGEGSEVIEKEVHKFAKQSLNEYLEKDGKRLVKEEVARILDSYRENNKDAEEFKEEH